MTDYPLIAAEDALRLHGQDGVVFADASFHLPTTGRDAQAEFAEGRIEGAVWFDINTIADPASDQPHTMPDADLFEAAMRQLGINQGDRIIVYDQSVFYSSARAWYMLRLFGHADIQVLDGGFKAWVKAGGPTESGTPVASPAGNFNAGAAASGETVILIDALKQIIGRSDAQIVDARAAGRFNGTEPEPRPGLRSGHMPGAINIPIGSLIDKQTGLFKQKHELDAIFSALDLEKPIITTCGSGVTACGLALGLAAIGQHGVTLYDGSWSEWGSREDCPISV